MGIYFVCLSLLTVMLSICEECLGALTWAPATCDESPLSLLEPAVVAGPVPMVLIMIAPHSNTQGHLKRQGLLLTRPGEYRHVWGHTLRSWLKRAQSWILPFLGVKVGCLGFHEFTLY